MCHTSRSAIVRVPTQLRVWYNTHVFFFSFLESRNSFLMPAFDSPGALSLDMSCCIWTATSNTEGRISSDMVRLELFQVSWFYSV